MKREKKTLKFEKVEGGLRVVDQSHREVEFGENGKNRWKDFASISFPTYSGLSFVYVCGDVPELDNKIIECSPAEQDRLIALAGEYEAYFNGEEVEPVEAKAGMAACSACYYYNERDKPHCAECRDLSHFRSKPAPRKCTMKAEKTCGNCAYVHTSNCYAIVGSCVDHDRWISVDVASSLDLIEALRSIEARLTKVFITCTESNVSGPIAAAAMEARIALRKAGVE